MLLPTLALAFTLGVAVSGVVSVCPLQASLALCGGLLTLLLAYRTPSARGTGLLLFLLLLCAGALRGAMDEAPRFEAPPGDLGARSRRAWVEDGPWPSERDGWWADVVSEVAPGRAERVRLHGVGSPAALDPGDVIAFRSELRRRLPSGNPGGHASRRDAPRWSAWVNHPAAVVRLGRFEGWEAGLQQQRHDIALRLRTLAGTREGGTLAALGLGVRQMIDTGTRARFATTGTAHALAVSGLHLGLVALWAHALLRWLLTRSTWLLRRVRMDRLVNLGTLFVVVGFTLWSGAATATVRALLMVALWLVGRVLDAHVAPTDALAVAVLGLLGVAPQSLSAPSFQLSVAAVTGIVAAAPLGQRVSRRWLAEGTMGPLLLRAGRALWGAAWVSLAAGVATAPVIAAHFHQTTPAALAANLLVVPLLGLVVLPLALFAVAALLVAPPSWHETLLALPARCAEVWLDSVATLAEGSAAPAASSSTVAVAFAVAGAVAVLAALVAPLQRLPRVALLGLGALLVGTPALLPLLDGGPGNGFHAFVLNVGHGNAALLRTGEGRVWLVDGGGARSGEPGVGRARVLPALRALGIEGVDTMVMSHGHADHAVGLLEVVAARPVGELWLPNAPTESPYGARLATQTWRRGGELHAVSAGAARGRVEVLWPELGSPVEGENNRSVVLRAHAGGGRLLLPGDIEEPAEANLARGGRDLRAEVMLAPHHGSRTSSSAALLDAVQPRAVVYSRGRGHRPALPSPEVLSRYREHGTVAFDTARDGAVEIRTTETGIGLRGWNEGPEGVHRCWWLGTLEEWRAWCL